MMCHYLDCIILLYYYLSDKHQKLYNHQYHDIHPKSYYKELQIDRFYDTPTGISNDAYIHWDFSIDTHNMAKDSFVQKYPRPLSQNPSLPPAQRRF